MTTILGGRAGDHVHHHKKFSCDPDTQTAGSTRESQETFTLSHIFDQLLLGDGAAHNMSKVARLLLCPLGTAVFYSI